MVGNLSLGVPASLGATDAAVRAREAARALAAVLGRPVESRLAPSYAQLRDWLAAGKVAFAWCPPLVAADLVRAARSAPRVLVFVRHGQVSYRAAVVARADAGVALGALSGRKAAWVEPESMGGCLLPRLALRRAGADLAELSESYAGSYRASLIAVLNRKADLGAAFLPHGAEPPFASLVGEAFARELEVLVETPPCPNDGLALSPALPAADAGLLHAALLGLGASPNGRAALASAFECEALAEATPELYRAAFELLGG